MICSPPERLVERMEAEQMDLLAVIFGHYTMNETERAVLPHYQRITDLFQWPNVCAMIKWLKEDARREKCAELIRILVGRALA